MQPSEMTQLLKRSFDDRFLSKAEKKELRDMIRATVGQSGAHGALRQAAFDVARNALAEKDMITLNWLEDVVKLLLGQSNPGASARPASEAWFSPGSDCLEAISGLIDGTNSTLDICVFTITDNRIVDRIKAAKRRGVAVRIISDNDKAEDRGSDIDALAASGIAVRTDQTENHMHHKFALFDGTVLVTGSYNWTRSAAAVNEENIVVLHDKGLVKQFNDEFKRLWPLMSPHK